MGLPFPNPVQIGLQPQMDKVVFALYWLASSLVKVNGETGKDFKLSKLVR
jgi:hypothetical protein